MNMRPVEYLCRQQDLPPILTMGDGNFITYQNSTLFYRKTGTGANALLVFHGFGQNHEAFEAMAGALGDAYTVYAFDLYFHGKSKWGYDEQPLEKSFLKEVIGKFLSQNNLDRFAIAGFSLGARFAMAITEEFPSKVDHLFLLAPDGIRSSFWFTMSTYPVALRKVFKSMIRHPGRFKVIVNTLHELRMMNKGLLKFAEHQMNTVEKRRKVYFSWVVFRHLKFNRKKLVQLLNANNIPVTIVIGQQDRVITTKSVRGFIGKIHRGNLIVINTGHAAFLRDPQLIALFKGD